MRFWKENRFTSPSPLCSERAYISANGVNKMSSYIQCDLCSEEKNSDEGRVNRKILVIAILATGKVTSHTAWWYQQEKSRLKYGFLWSYISSKTPLEKKNDILSAASQPSQTMGHTVVIVSKNYNQVAIRSRPLLFAHGSHCPKKTPATNYPKV